MSITQWPDMIGHVDNENCPDTKNERGVRCPELGPDDCSNPTPRPTLFFDKNDRTAYEKARATGAGGLEEGAGGLKPEEGVGAEQPEEGAGAGGLEEGAGGLEEGEEAKEPEEEGPEEEALPDIPLPNLGLPVGLDECVCDTWINITTCSDCTQQFFRSCEPEGCDDEKETREGCCQDCAPGSMFDGLRCKLCPAGSFKAEQGPGGCKGCPNTFDSEEGSTAMSDCKDPCEGCGLWIDVGDCPPPVYIHNFLSL